MYHKELEDTHKVFLNVRRTAYVFSNFRLGVYGRMDENEEVWTPPRSVLSVFEGSFLLLPLFREIHLQYM